MAGNTRFDRMERTDWIDMRRIHPFRVFVAGAGALGNEVLKDLALAGFRDISVADPDSVEESNLSRCVLFRPHDIGENKAFAAARSVYELDPDCRIRCFADRLQNVDLDGYDVFVGCLDSISARLHLNSHSMHLRVPYVDGATDGFRGKVQVVRPGGPCLECAMNRTHLNELHRTFSCMPGGASEPVILSSGITTASVIAGICVREVLKIACGIGNRCVEGVSYYDGMNGTLDIMGLGINTRCPNHEDLYDTAP